MMEDFDSEYDSLDQLLQSIQDAREDIVTSESIEFEQRWGEDRATVPVTLIDWELIIRLLMKDPEAKDVIGDWRTKLQPSDKLRKGLGVVAHLEEPFIEYINLSRRSNIKQNIALFTKLGCIDLTFDDAGREKYIMLEFPFDDDALGGFVKDTLTAYDTFR